MALSPAFNEVVAPDAVPKAVARRRSAPFSLRLSAAERDQLRAEAGDQPLGAYIKAKVLGGSRLRSRRSGLAVEDRAALAQVLALLGQSRIANNLNQLAFAANTGALPEVPDAEERLLDALEGVRNIRVLLLGALGLKAPSDAEEAP
jgi:hypothetical protein